MEQESIERQVMEKLLAGDHPSLDVLRAQYTAAEVAKRDFTGSGFFTYFSVPPAVPRISPPRLQLTDLHLELVGAEHGAGVILFIDRGVIEVLEIYMWAEEWPVHPEIADIYYMHETPRAGGRGYDLHPVPQRDPATLARGLRT